MTPLVSQEKSNNKSMTASAKEYRTYITTGLAGLQNQQDQKDDQILVTTINVQPTGQISSLATYSRKNVATFFLDIY